jgi:hypothetical protein
LYPDAISQKAGDGMSWIDRFDSKWLRRWAIRLGIVAWVVLALPVLTVFALISVIGIPLGLVMMATPTIALVFVFAYVVQRLHGRDGPAAVAISFGLALLVLAGIARLANARLDHRADEYLAGDVDTLERPLRADSIGLASYGYFGRSKGESRCEETCQRLLLSGTAQRVLVADGKPDQKGWTAEMPALAYRIEERESCPPVHVSERRAAQPVDDAKPAEAMRIAIATGRCLIEEPALLTGADVVITAGRLHRGPGDFEAGLSLFAETVSAYRASVHVREPKGFVERYRWTGVTVRRHPLIPVPTLVGGVELNMKAGFTRSEEDRNTREFAQDDVDVVRFLRDELGFPVAVPSNASRPTHSELITRALEGSAPIEPAVQRVIEDFFRSFMDAKSLDEPVRKLAFRALADPRVVAPRETWTLVRTSEKAGDAVRAELAGILFAKIMTTDPQRREDHPSYLGWPASYLANSISMLPPHFVLPYRRELETLARDPARRQHTHRALPLLSTFGSDAVPTLLFLVDAAIEIRTRGDKGTPGKRPEDWQDLYGAGLTGLCRLGSEGSAALAPMMAKLRDGTLPIGASNHDRIITTLVVLGADPQELRSRLVKEESGRARVERAIERAMKKPDCGS